MTGVDGARMVTIEVEVPVDVYARHHEHIRELGAELHVIKAGRDVHGAVVAPEITHLIAELLDRFRDARNAHVAELAAAQARGDATLAVRTSFPATGVEDAIAAAETLLSLLEQADDVSRRRQVLTLPAPADVVEFRRWYVAECVRRFRETAGAS